MVKNMWTVVWNLLWHYGQSFEELGWEMADNRLNNIVNAIAPQPQTITSVDGIPTTLLLDPRGRMKCTYTVARDGTATFGPTDIRNITVPVTELDYNKVDTVSFLPKVCTPDGKCN